MTISPRGLCAATALFVLALPVGACGAGGPEGSGELTGLRLVHSDPFSIIFMRDAPLDRPVPRAPVEVETWSFFDEPTRPGRGPGWNTRISRLRIDCQAGTMAALNHKVFQDEAPVDDVTPLYEMEAPNGPAQASVMTWVCDPEEEPHETVVRDLPAARRWAEGSWPILNPDHPARQTRP